MTELEQKMRERVSRNTFMVHNFIEPVSVEPDYAVFRLNIHPESKNTYGFVHGGALYTLADNATGTAVHTDGRRYVTQNGALHFIANQTEGIIRAAARVRHRGRATAVVSVDLLGDGDKLLATGEFTFFCTDIR